MMTIKSTQFVLLVIILNSSVWGQSTFSNEYGQSEVTKLPPIDSPLRKAAYFDANREVFKSVERQRILRKTIKNSIETPAKWSVDTDYLNWQIRRRDLDYAIKTSQAADALGPGTIKELRFGQSSGTRLRINYPLDENWVVSFGHKHYSNESFSSISVASTDVLFATRSHPKFNEEAESANAYGSLELDTYDIELSHLMVNSNRASFEIFGGLLWADNVQQFDIDYDGKDFSAGKVQNNTNITSFGLRFGAEGIWNITDSFYAFGSGEASLMFGDYDTSIVETEQGLSGDTITIVDVTDSYEQTIPMLSASLGVGWNSEHAGVRLGYEFSSWMNFSDRTVFLDDTHEGVYSKGNHDLMFDGLFIRATLVY